MMPETIVITDTSVLINFLVLDEVALLSRLPGRSFVVTDHVRAEITAHHSEQLQRLEQAFASGMLEEIRVTDLEEVQLFAKLTATGLGIGECSAIAVAPHCKLALAIDDKRAMSQDRSLPGNDRRQVRAAEWRQGVRRRPEARDWNAARQGIGSDPRNAHAGPPISRPLIRSLGKQDKYRTK
jgi:predicted nucleic acid-binding protein